MKKIKEILISELLNSLGPAVGVILISLTGLIFFKESFSFFQVTVIFILYRISNEVG